MTDAEPIATDNPERRPGHRTWVWPALLLALSLFAVAPLAAPGYHWGAQDARHSVYFLQQFDRSIRDGILYPRWAPDIAFGYGYPFFSVYAPLSSAVGEVFHLAGLDLVSSVEAVFALGAVASALAMYLWLRLYARPPVAMLGALLYLYAPYHIVDLYVRASLAEVVALAFLPLCLWAFARLLGTGQASATPTPANGLGEALTQLWRDAGAIVIAAASYAGLMLSSNIMALLFTPVLGGYILVLVAGHPSRFPKGAEGVGFAAITRLIPVAAAASLGLGLSAVFWLPAFSEARFLRQDQWLGGYYAYRNHFVYPFQLLSLAWGSGPSIAGPDDGMSFQLGLAPVALTALALLSWGRLAPAWRRAGAYFLTVTAALVLLMLPLSLPLWDAIGLARFAQFPWRLLSLTALSLAFVATAAFAHWRRAEGATALLFAVLIIMPVYPYLRADTRRNEPDEVSLAGLMRFMQSSGEMVASPVWATAEPIWSPLADQIVAGIEITTKVDYTAAYASGRLAVHSQAYGTMYERVWFQADDDAQRIRFNTFYFPGWNGYILDENTGALQQMASVQPEGDLGLISVAVPRGRHVLLLRFDDTPPRTAGKWLTVVAAGLCLAVAAGRGLTRRRR